MHKLLCLLLLISSIIVPVSRGYAGTNKDSAINMLNNITVAYQKGKIDETTYLKSIYSSIQQIMTQNVNLDNKELLHLLEPFRRLAWSGKDYEYRRLYYTMLSNYAQMFARYGEMLYYGEKIDRLEQEATRRPSLAASTIIADYYMIHQAYPKMSALFAKEKDYLLRIPQIAKETHMDVTDLVQATFLLEKYSNALYRINDSPAIAAMETALEGIAGAATTGLKANKENGNILANVEYSKISVLYHRASAREDTGLQQQVFRRMDGLLLDSITPDYLKPAIYNMSLYWRVSYYLKYYNADSLNQYLTLYEECMKNEEIPYNQYLLKRYKAEALYRAGRYKESADILQASDAHLDSSRSTLMQDIDNMLYAQAKSEEQQQQLKEADERNRRKEVTINIILVSGLVLITIGVGIVWYIRQRQRRRFLEFKLNLARNIHDETGPALLYAKTLARVAREKNDIESGKSEMELHLEHTIEVIRSLSHDLKSDEQNTIGDIIATTEHTLKKLNVNNEFTYHLHEKIGEKRFLSHYQFSHLKAILQECITNTIKHASFNKIDIHFLRNGNKLIITYTDNGQGWHERNINAGIGMQNMKERTEKLNGDFVIINNYPKGYKVNLTVSLQ